MPESIKAFQLLLLLITGPLVAIPALAQAPMGGPPAEALQACAGQHSGASCEFSAPHGKISGSCQGIPGNRTACVPTGGPKGRAGGMPGAQTPNGNRPAQGPRQASMTGAGPARVDIDDRYKRAIPVESRLPDTHQGSCFDTHKKIDCPAYGQPLYGQDAHYEGRTPAYRDNRDGTITDLVTGLYWQKAHNDKRLNWYNAKAYCEGLQLGGQLDWRLPNIKELFSLADFRGTVGKRPYLNEVFEIREPGEEVLQGDPFASSHHTDMMGQTWSSTIYAGNHWDRHGIEAAFFFNFLDGRIKQAPTRGRATLFYRCVRGETWGENAFIDNRDGTITDRASGLMWQQSDDGQTYDWPGALAYCEDLRLAGHGDWRLPNVKELQSLVDYHRYKPALNTRYFTQRDGRGWFWSSTTLGDNVSQAAYVCFGKCTSVEGVDVHGAGAQRSDPKTGNPARFSSQGGQQDEIRINNYARCVRSAPASN